MNGKFEQLLLTNTWAEDCLTTQEQMIWKVVELLARQGFKVTGDLKIEKKEKPKCDREGCIGGRAFESKDGKMYCSPECNNIGLTMDDESFWVEESESESESDDEL